MHKNEITVTQAMSLLSCSRQTVIRMIQRGSLIAHKLDPNAKSVYRLSRSSVEKVRGQLARTSLRHR